MPVAKVALFNPHEEQYADGLAARIAHHAVNRDEPLILTPIPNVLVVVVPAQFQRCEIDLDSLSDAVVELLEERVQVKRR